MRGEPSLVRSEAARSVCRREEKREERTGWRINQRGSCKSRVEARDTSLALSCSKSATAAIEIDLTLPYGRHRRPYHRNYGPDPRRGLRLEFLETIYPQATWFTDARADFRANSGANSFDQLCRIKIHVLRSEVSFILFFFFSVNNNDF